MTITRQAILIGAPNVPPFLPGVLKDLRDLEAFLKSPTGGKWRSDEITVLNSPSPEIIKLHLEMAKHKDYVFISCSGHGEHRVGAGADSTVILLDDRKSIAINEMNPKNKRHFVLVDVCRAVVKAKLISESAALTKALLDSAHVNVDHRKVFDTALSKTTEGRIVAYSCDINQSAGEDEAGGYFTQSMLRAAGAYASHADQGKVVDIEKAFKVAKQNTYDTNAPQTPVLLAGRRNDYFPFAIV